ncbi:hypothetical protein R1sor_011765 [Riccia sorocarpa]|uniref:Uncharacterized protein n=1 Tax=Riccia sorocarpa TaxID=122646 RepID=A0ABD3I3Q5_9MARC
MEHIPDLLAKITDKSNKRQLQPTARNLMRWVTEHRHLYPLYPLFGMVTLAFGLAGMTAVRTLVIAPNVYPNKEDRHMDNLPEIKEPEKMTEKGKVYKETSPLYKFAKGTTVGAAIAKLQHVPPVLPGDESSATGSQGTAVNRGRRAGGY